MNEDDLRKAINRLIVEAYAAAGIASPGSWHPGAKEQNFPRMRGVLLKAVALGRDQLAAEIDENLKGRVPALMEVIRT